MAIGLVIVGMTTSLSNSLISVMILFISALLHNTGLQINILIFSSPF